MSNDGGPAFPSSPVIDGNGEKLRPADIGCEGMTLRDYFAAKTLASSANVVPASAWQCVRWAIGLQYRSCLLDPAHLSRNAYALADAMLAERAKGPK